VVEIDTDPDPDKQALDDDPDPDQDPADPTGFGSRSTILVSGHPQIFLASKFVARRIQEYLPTQQVWV
jgi:hypothetical protein